MAINHTAKDAGSGTQSQWKQFVIAAAILVAALVVSVVAWGSWTRPTISGIWYYDTQTGSLFAGDGSLPPITAPSGGLTGVKAYTFACGSCDDRGNLKVAYLETFPKTADEELVRLTGGTRKYSAIDGEAYAQLMALAQVMKPDGKEWTSYFDGLEAGVVAVPTCDNGAAATLCLGPTK